MQDPSAESKCPIVLVDVDGTLLAGQSYIYFFHSLWRNRRRRVPRFWPHDGAAEPYCTQKKHATQIEQPKQVGSNHGLDSAWGNNGRSH